MNPIHIDNKTTRPIRLQNPSITEQSPLLKFPAELRNYIYELALTYPRPITLCQILEVQITNAFRFTSWPRDPTCARSASSVPETLSPRGTKISD